MAITVRVWYLHFFLNYYAAIVILTDWYALSEPAPYKNQIVQINLKYCLAENTNLLVRYPAYSMSTDLPPCRRTSKLNRIHWRTLNFVVYALTCYSSSIYKKKKLQQISDQSMNGSWFSIYSNESLVLAVRGELRVISRISRYRRSEKRKGKLGESLSSSYAMLHYVHFYGGDPGLSDRWHTVTVQDQANRAINCVATKVLFLNETFTLLQRSTNSLRHVILTHHSDGRFRCLLKQTRVVNE